MPAAQRGSRHLGRKTLRHWLGGSELPGHFGTNAHVSKGQFGPKCRSVLPQGPNCLAISLGKVECITFSNDRTRLHNYLSKNALHLLAM